MDAKRTFEHWIGDARYALDALEDMLRCDRVTTDEFMAVVGRLDQAGLLTGWDGPQLDQLRKEMTWLFDGGER
jgi:hypothetical protein